MSSQVAYMTSLMSQTVEYDLSIKHNPRRHVGLWRPLRFRSPGVSTDEELHPLAGATDDAEPRG